MTPGARPGERPGEGRDSPRTEQLLRALTSRGLRYGREDSFKLYRDGVLEDRVLLGTRAADIGPDALLQVGAELGMPACYRPVLEEHFPRADMVLLGLEDRADGGVFKVYLEFWDELKRRVLATGSPAPALLNLGVKWDTASGAHCRADYVCYPLLSPGGILGRLERLYGGLPTRTSHVLSARLILQAVDRAPDATFIYLEVGEEGSPRKSFDINLYKAGLVVSDARPLLGRVCRDYGIDPGRLAGVLDRVGGRPLGHLSAGLDRHGRDYATIYYEISALEVPAG